MLLDEAVWSHWSSLSQYKNRILFIINGIAIGWSKQHPDKRTKSKTDPTLRKGEDRYVMQVNIRMSQLHSPAGTTEPTPWTHKDPDWVSEIMQTV